MNCCPNCFSDSFIISRINTLSYVNGDCNYCLTKNTPVVSPTKLTDYFEPLLDIYDKSDAGIRFDQLIQEDWNTFNLDDDNRRRLLDDILRVSGISSLKYIPKCQRNQAIVEEWNGFTCELMHTNRFMPEKSPKIESFEKFGELLGVIVEPAEKKIYRARINEGCKPFDIEHMGKPPQEIAPNGRANPIGISYFYAASDEKTAISELRGFKSEYVTVLEFSILECRWQ